MSDPADPQPSSQPEPPAADAAAADGAAADAPAADGPAAGQAAGPQAAGPPPEPLWRRLARFPATVVLLLAAGFLFWRAYAAEPVFWGFSLENLESLGGYTWRAVRDEGETWRLLTNLLVSRMAIDLLLFVYLFVILAPQLERGLGTLRFLVLFFVSGAGGTALAEVFFDPSLRAGGPLVGAYALLGAVPGVVLGTTWSLKQTVADPNARSAVFWIGFSCLLGYLFLSYGRGMTWDFGSTLCATGLALALGVTLGLSKRQLKWGVVATLLVSQVAVFGAVALHEGLRWRGGGLVDRGRPAHPLAGPYDAGQGPDGARETTGQRLARRAETFLGSWSPLPTGEERLSVDQGEEARELLEDIEAEPLETALKRYQVRLHLLLSEPSSAYRAASELAILDPSSEAEALAGTAAWHDASAEWDPDMLETARQRLERAALDEDYAARVPEVWYLYARTLDDAQRIEEARAAYQRYLDQVAGEDPQPYWRDPLLQRARLFVDPN